MVPRRWAHATVSASLHCRHCGYDLRGLDASGRCPECGFDVWSSVVHTVDPTSSRLPSLRNPIAVGNARAHDGIAVSGFRRVTPAAESVMSALR